MRRDLALIVFLVLVTLAVYGQVVDHAFVNFDDNEYVYENPHVQRGLTGKGFGWALTTTRTGNWHPVTWLSHMIDCELFGLTAGCHHLVNVFLHILNSVLLYLVLRCMTGEVWRSAMVAAMFALHPLHVESVAWISERKDVLSTLFFMLTLWAYGRYAASPSRMRYGLVLGFLAWGLMAKPMLVTLPFVLLLLDFWPLGRFQPGGTRSRLVVEKLPLLALAAASSVATFVAQRQEGAMSLTYVVPFMDRIANALVTYVAYMGKMLWPGHLAVFYPYRDALPTGLWVGAALVLAGITVLAGWAGRRRRYLAVGWLWYLGTLVPVIGFVQVGAQSMADRYTYVPLIGLFVMVVWTLGDVAARWRHARIGIAALAGAAILGCVGATWIQVGHWRSGITLFEHTLKVTKNNALAHTNLGAALKEAGRENEAIRQYREALRIDPDHANAHVNLGIALMGQGEEDQAITHYREAVRIRPGFAQAHNQLGIALAQRGEIDEAVSHYREAVRARSDFARAHSNLGAALMARGNTDEAITCLRLAVQLDPDSPQAHGNLATALMLNGKPDEGIAQYRQALRIDPAFAEGHLNLAIALAQQGSRDEAITHHREAVRLNPRMAEVPLDLETARSTPESIHDLAVSLAMQGEIDEAVDRFREALRLDPRRAEFHTSLALALVVQGEVQEAIDHYREAIRLKPGDPRPNNNLAWIRATHPDPKFRNGTEAVRLAERALKLSGDRDPGLLDTLAAAYAEAGRFPEAISTLQEAIWLAKAAGAEGLTPSLEERLRGYEAGRPYREAHAPREPGEQGPGAHPSTDEEAPYAP